MSKTKLIWIIIIILFTNNATYCYAQTLTQEESALEKIHLAESSIKNAVDLLNKAGLKDPDDQTITDLNVALNLIILAKYNFDNKELIESIIKASESVEITQHIIQKYTNYPTNTINLINIYSQIFIFLIILAFVSIFAWILIKKNYNDRVLKMKPGVTYES